MDLDDFFQPHIGGGRWLGQEGEDRRQGEGEGLLGIGMEELVIEAVLVDTIDLASHLSAATVTVLNENGSAVGKREEPQSCTQAYPKTLCPTSADVT